MSKAAKSVVVLAPSQVPEEERVTLPSCSFLSLLGSVASKGRRKRLASTHRDRKRIEKDDSSPDFKSASTSAASLASAIRSAGSAVSNSSTSTTMVDDRSDLTCHSRS